MSLRNATLKIMNPIEYEKYDELQFSYGSLIITLEFMEHREGGSPKFVAVDQDTDTGEPDIWAETDSTKSDLKILVDERLMALSGGDFYLTGYGFTDKPPVETYRGVKIGRYVLRGKSKALPKFGAFVDIPNSIDSILAEGRTVAQVRKEIGRILDR